MILNTNNNCFCQSIFAKKIIERCYSYLKLYLVSVCTQNPQFKSARRASLHPVNRRLEQRWITRGIKIISHHTQIPRPNMLAKQPSIYIIYDRANKPATYYRHTHTHWREWEAVSGLVWSATSNRFNRVFAVFYRKVDSSPLGTYTHQGSSIEECEIWRVRERVRLLCVFCVI